MKHRHERVGVALATMALIVLGTGCTSREEGLAPRLRDWNFQIVRSSWSCDAMSINLERWLDTNKDELRDEVQGLTERLDAMAPELRASTLDAIAAPQSDALRAARAACSQHPGVQKQFLEMSRLMAPLMTPQSDIDQLAPVPEAKQTPGPTFTR